MLTPEQRAVLVTMRQDGRNRVSQARAIANMTQVELAARSGLTQSYISRLEHGQYAELPEDTATTLAGCFGCQVGELFPERVPAVQGA